MCVCERERERERERMRERDGEIEREREIFVSKWFRDFLLWRPINVRIAVKGKSVLVQKHILVVKLLNIK